MTRCFIQTRSKASCWAPLVLGFIAIALTLSQHQRALRHWQKLISSVARSAEFQWLADLALANGAAIGAAVAFTALLACFSPVLRMYR